MSANENIKKLLTTVGLGAKARAIVCGTEQICEALRNEKKKPMSHEK